MASRVSDRISFSKKEDLAILEFILKDNRLYFSSGLNIWKRAVSEEICPGRGFWSLKERFMKTICRNLQNYNLPIEKRHKILNYVKASPAEKKRLRNEYGDDQDYKYVQQAASIVTITNEEKVINDENEINKKKHVELDENVIIKEECVEFDENIIVKEECIETNENDGLQNESQSDAYPESHKNFQDDRNYLNEIVPSLDSKLSIPFQGIKNISDNQPILTNIKYNVFLEQDVRKTKSGRFQMSNNSIVNPKVKQKSCSEPEGTNTLSSIKTKQLQIHLTRLKNL